MIVVPVQKKREMKQFIDFPWQLYDGNPDWVPPLRRDMKASFDPDRHPFYKHSEAQLFLALRRGVPVGRIAAIRNRNHERVHGESVGFFGWFECVDDDWVGSSLLDAARAWLRERGISRMRGPASFSMNETCGVLLGGDPGPPTIMMAYNPPWYPRLLEMAGLEKVKDLFAWILPVTDPPPQLLRAEKIVSARYGIRTRPLQKKKMRSEMGRVRELFNAVWEENWGFVPMTDAEIVHMAAHLKPIVDPNLAIFAESRTGDTIGFALAIPDFNQVLRHMNGRLLPFGILKAAVHSRRIDFTRVLILGLKKEWRGKGVDHLLTLALYRGARAGGYKNAELSWILEDNTAMNRALERLGGRVSRTYRMYEGPVQA